MRTISEIEAEKYRIDCEARVFDSDGITTTRHAEICKAERDGRCVVLPCRVGDTVYARKYVLSQKNYSVVECVCAAIKIFRDGNLHVEAVVNGGIFKMELGRQVFLTREAAEAALKECEANG